MSRRLRPVFALALPLALGCHRPTPPPADDGPLTVTAAKPLVKNMALFSDFTGQIQAPQSVTIRARVSGYISKIDFKDGDEVKKDDVLIEIDPVIYEAQLKQAQGEVKDYEAQLRLYTAELGRTEELVKKGAVSQNEYDQAVAKKDVAAAKIFTSKAQVAQAQQNLDWTKVTSPITGRIDRIFLTPGNVATGGATEGTALTTLVSVDPMYAYFNVDEQSVLYYQKLVRQGKATDAHGGQGIPIKIKLMDESQYTHDATLDFVANQLDPSTGALQVRATVPNPKIDGVRTFYPGLFIRGRFPLGQPVDTILIPDEAVVADQGNKIVYVVGADNRVAAKPVKLGPLVEGLRVVSEGVGPDDRVVIRGVIRMQPGIPVDPQPGEVKPIPGR